MIIIKGVNPTFPYHRTAKLPKTILMMVCRMELNKLSKISIVSIVAVIQFIYIVMIHMRKIDIGWVLGTT